MRSTGNLKRTDSPRLFLFPLGQFKILIKLIRNLKRLNTGPLNTVRSRKKTEHVIKRTGKRTFSTSMPYAIKRRTPTGATSCGENFKKNFK